jgi:hypothetical protein
MQFVAMKSTGIHQQVYAIIQLIVQSTATILHLKLQTFRAKTLMFVSFTYTFDVHTEFQIALLWQLPMHDKLFIFCYFYLFYFIMISCINAVHKKTKHIIINMRNANHDINSQPPGQRLNGRTPVTYVQNYAYLLISQMQHAVE